VRQQGKTFIVLLTIEAQGYKTLEEGEEVEFDVVETSKGPQASKVVRI